MVQERRFALDEIQECANLRGNKSLRRIDEPEPLVAMADVPTWQNLHERLIFAVAARQKIESFVTGVDLAVDGGLVSV